MANTYGIYNSGSVVLEYWFGNVKAKELFEHQQLQEADDAISDLATSIVDFRDVTFDLTDDEVVQFAEFISQENPCQKREWL